MNAGARGTQDPRQNQLMNAGARGTQDQSSNEYNGSGGFNQRKVSFDNNIKVIEIDTKVNNGFIYSGSSKLDPFTNKL